MNYEDEVKKMVEVVAQVLDSVATEVVDSVAKKSEKVSKKETETKCCNKEDVKNKDLSNLAAIVDTLYKDVQDLKERLAVEENASDADLKIMGDMNKDIKSLIKTVQKHEDRLDNLREDMDNFIDTFSDEDDESEDDCCCDEHDCDDYDEDDCDDCDDCEEDEDEDDEEDILAYLKKTGCLNISSLKKLASNLNGLGAALIYIPDEWLK